MRNFYLLCSLLVSSIVVNAQRFDWVSFTPITGGNSGSGGLAVATDNDLNSYNVAVFNDPIVIGDDTLEHMGNFNRPDIVLTKWNEAGEVIAYRQFANWSTNGNPDPHNLLFDQVNGHILMTVNSYYNGMQVTLISNGSQADTLLTLAAGSVLRFDSDLRFISKKDIPGGPSYGTPAAIKNNFIYVAQGYNSVISKIDTSGNVLWSITPTGTTYAIADLALSSDNHVYVIGHYHSNQISHNGVTLGGITVTPPSAGNNSHVIIFKIDSNGNVLNGQFVAEGQYSLAPVRVATDLSGNVFAAIPYPVGGQVIGSDTLSSPTGANDGFVVKFNANLQAQWVTEFHHTGGNMELRDIVVNEAGKVTTIGLYGGNATLGDFELSASQFGTSFLAQLDNSDGSILYATSFGVQIGTARPYSLTNVGDKYFITGLSFGTTLTQASYGCYTHSLALSYLTLFNDTTFVSPEVMLQYNSPVLVATSNVSNADYTWFLDGVELPGETGSSIVPVLSGTYEVKLNYYGCTSSASLPITVSSVGIDHINKAGSDIFIYPNPAQNSFTIHSLPTGAIVNIKEITGKLVFSSTQTSVDISHLENGIYLVSIEKYGIIATRKLIVSN